VPSRPAPGTTSATPGSRGLDRATLVRYGSEVAARIEKVAPDAIDLIVDLVGGDALREVAHLAKVPEVIEYGKVVIEIT